MTRRLREQPEGQRRGVHERLVPHRRPGHAGRRRLPQHHRAAEGDHQPRRREDLPARGRRGADGPPGGGAGRVPSRMPHDKLGEEVAAAAWCCARAARATERELQRLRRRRARRLQGAEARSSSWTRSRRARPASCSASAWRQKLGPRLNPSRWPRGSQGPRLHDRPRDSRLTLHKISVEPPRGDNHEESSAFQAPRRAGRRRARPPRARGTGRAWEPTKPVEFIVPAGTGGGADQMARFIQGVVAKHNLMKQPIVVVNKSGGAGAEGFLDVKDAKGDPHKIIITLSNLFTTPLATGVPFNWRDLTPVPMLALDEFVLWVNEESPYKTAKAYFEARQGAPAEQLQDGRHRLQAGRPDHHRRAREGRRQEVDLRAVQGRRRGGGAARRQAHRLDGEQPDRGRSALARRQAAAAVRDGQGAHAVQGQADGRRSPGRTSRPAPRPACRSTT